MTSRSTSGRDDDEIPMNIITGDEPVYPEVECLACADGEIFKYFSSGHRKSILYA